MESPSATYAHSNSASLTLLWGTWELWCDVPVTRAVSYVSEQQRRYFCPPETSWLDKVKSVGLFDSAEGFWGLFRCTLFPSQLPPNSSYYLFRKHIAPMWEHEANRRGGKWVISFNHLPTSSATTPNDAPSTPVDVAWQKVCLAIIGEQLPCEEEEVCGVTVSRAKPRGSGGASTTSEWKLCIWTRTADNAEVQLAIAQFILALLKDSRTGDEAKQSSDDLALKLSYVAHRELMEAKQNFSKGTAPSGAFEPKYSVP